MTTLALLLGNNSYKPPIESLKCCEKDARELTGLLKDGLGFDAHYMEERKAEDIYQRIEDLGTRLTPGDTFIFYFSGHGKNHQDDYFLLLPGASLNVFERRSAVVVGVLSYNHLKLLTSGPGWQGVHRLFIFDACRSHLTVNKGPGDTLAFEGEYLLRAPKVCDKKKEPDDENLTVINSCALGASAVELPGQGNEAGHGVFTAALLDELRQDKARTQWLIDRSFVHSLGQRMAALARQCCIPQSLWHEPALVGDGIRLFAGSGGVNTPPPSAAPTVSATELDTRLWRLARLDNTEVAYRQYIKDAPPGAAHVDEAFERIEGLRQAAKPKTPEPIPTPPPPAKWSAGQVLRDANVAPELVVIPPGEFLMGSPESEPERASDEGPQHRVKIGYWLAVGKYPVTQREWQAVMGSNPSHFKGCGDCPVETVSWDDAQAYLKKLNELTDNRYGYRLLSDAEWEYACRAGTTTPFSTGQTITTAQANFNGRSTYNGSAQGKYRGKTTPVGSFAPNAYGLYDMHGNVWEWVEDIGHDCYEGAPTDGSAWMNGGDQGRRVLRGGSWNNNPRYLRSAYRYRYSPVNRNDDNGFRVARTLP